jgi:hypothetical protein
MNGEIYRKTFVSSLEKIIPGEMMQLGMNLPRFHDSDRKARCRREEYLPVFATDLGFSTFYNIYKKQKALIALD